MPNYIITETDITAMEPETRKLFLQFLEAQLKNRRSTEKPGALTLRSVEWQKPNVAENVSIETMISVLSGLNPKSRSLISSVLEGDTFAKISERFGSGLNGTIGSINRRFRRRLSKRYDSAKSLLNEAKFLHYIEDRTITLEMYKGGKTDILGVAFNDSFRDIEPTVYLALKVLEADRGRSKVVLKFPTLPYSKEQNGGSILVELNDDAIRSSDNMTCGVFTHDLHLEGDIDEKGRPLHGTVEYILRSEDRCHIITEDDLKGTMLCELDRLGEIIPEGDMFQISIDQVEILIDKDATAELNEQKKSNQSNRELINKAIETEDNKKKE